MRIAIAVFAKLVSVVIPLGRPSTDVAERAFERAVAQFYER
jgi:hypothetical protein